MKLTQIPFKGKVQIEGQVFQVEIDDLDARPIVATVDGERFEVWPEMAVGPANAPAATPSPGSLEHVGAQDPQGGAERDAGTPINAPSPHSAPRLIPPSGGDKSPAVRAPIPGVIVAITVKPGANVQIGDELCVLEAMKMRNAIRATRAGQIANVHVTVGQHVKHQELLVEFAP
jgi:biotin carboxyl carrier protein